MSDTTVFDGVSYVKGKAFTYDLMSLPEMLDRTAEQYKDGTAIIFYQQRITYGQLQASTRQVAEALYQSGVRKGDRVGIMLPNCPQFVSAFYGVLRRGAVVVQLNPLYTEREIEFVLQDSGAEVLFVFADLYARVRHLAGYENLKKVIVVSFAPSSLELAGNAVRWEDFLPSGSPVPDEPINPEEDIAVLQYTGGTTGRSKGAMLTHRNLVANVQQINAHASEDPLTAGDKILTVIPLFHVYGMNCAMNLGVLTATTVILLPRFDVLEVLQTIKEHRPTYFPGVPTMYVALNAYPGAEQYGIDAIRICNSGSAPLPVELMHAFEQKTGANMYEGYGLSEASPTTHSSPRNGTKKPGSIGIPLPGTEARIVDHLTGTRTLPIGEVGELVIRGPQVMKGYWNMPQETAHAIRDGWLYTGDLARVDEDGFFYIVDRKKDLIIASGYNVYPREIEEVLYTHPSVQEAVVVGVPDAYRGETVKAFVVLKQGQHATPEEIESYCRQHLAAFKVPRIIEFRDSLPKTAVGKILRRVLAEEAKSKA
ncbi:long-chain fatty acid--CoA ligase [Brevibacillus sp. SYP-B805]|uniref:long-chain-fatty-acid--CoA ligase n=1 Tax=Brevibacillus sp. SYP-B805 TaxID=1578199 RepID=UPI0013ECD040|nr:long-chain fatty acid--CoA ligase [Brevibacillus sp. SYP-B805]NGQ95801.1 long-chain fatty acid--CoA ligase [Brevibacillus sp. SYP-B805]